MPLTVEQHLLMGNTGNNPGSPSSMDNLQLSVVLNDITKL